MVVDEFPLLPVAEEVAALFRGRLEAEGWTVEVETNPRVRGRVNVKLEHPLVPSVHQFGANSPQMTVERTRTFLTSCFERHYQFEVVRGAPVRRERQDLVRRLRGIGTVRVSHDIGEAIISVGYALFEEGILLREEADWLAEAIRTDLREEEERFGGS